MDSVLSNEEIQVILTGTFGDGYIRMTESGVKAEYNTNCIYKDYIEYKADLLSAFNGKISYIPVNGYAGKPICTYRSRVQVGIKEIHDLSLSEKLDLMDELGFALWMYDDGSLHKRDFFYNINTHAFSEKENQLIAKKLLEKFGLVARVFTEKKKDGRTFHYLNVGNNYGAHKIAKILSKYPVKCYSYKIWSQERISRYDALTAELEVNGKLTPEELGPAMLSLKRKYKFK